ncbi:alpha/beta hydrolase [Parafrankia sp. BMG5.11]|uniref:alpha/beta hydrolase n=1 Tax=Parafrankia sp. BMG5.11 TaxID=222540 RepID=UPI001038A4B8|nr:alpha/beta hydrolase [Parafrankia sp. BMG5.11]TCJ37364.1 alpha/beta hydrolase [Parafrankia sp. BMG5.11]
MRRLFVLLLLFVLFTACVGAGDAPRAPQDATVHTSFEFSGWAGPAIRVWYQKPVRVSVSTPIVFVMHGVRRDADRYLAEWAPIAQRNGFILVVPEFSQADFPGSRGYNDGYLREEDGSLRPRSHWSFASIEPLFDEIKARTGTRSAAYALYGHSAGAQFVHRYVLLMPQARLSRAIAANAGWYTMPDLQFDYPYGLASTGVDEPALKRALTKPLTVLLGTADTDQDPNLRTTLDANAQGPHRYARGLNFHRHAEAAAARAGVPFGWRLLRVPGVGHSNSKMAISAAPLLAK